MLTAIATSAKGVMLGGIAPRYGFMDQINEMKNEKNG
jgi:hypothetical protein